MAVFHGTFGPIEAALRAYRIVGFDTEDDTRGTPLSFAFHDGVSSYYTRNADDALDYIYNYPVKAVFCAHNLEYDIGNLFKGCDFRYIKEMVYASRLLKVTLYGSTHFFLNTSSFFAGSLAKMGKILGLEKLEGDSLSEEYAVRDAQIVQLFGAKLQDRLHAQGVPLGLSIGQLAMATYRTNFLKAKVRTFNSPNCLKAYYGGRVEMFYKGVLEGNIYVADINSSYPDVMRRNEYPDTSYIEPSSIYTHTFGVGHFRIKVPSELFVPVLPYRSEAGRLFFPTGEIEGWWTYAEVRFAVAQGCEILAEYAGEGTRRGCRPFADFIDSFYEQRQVMKRRRVVNPEDSEAAFEDLFLKLLMNNLYGKFAQHKDGHKMTRVKLSRFELHKLGTAIETKQGPFYAYRVPKKRPPRTANYLWGVYVTSYARISLLEKIYAVHKAGGKLLYCDTDSVMFTGEKAKAALQYGDSLGKMSLETYDLAVFRASKGYLLCQKDGAEYKIKKVACKGVPTHLAHDFIVKGMAKVLKPMRLKEAMIRLNAEANQGKDDIFFRDIGVNVWRDVDKQMRSIYVKRKGERGVTYPLDAKEIPEAEEKAFGEPSSWESELGDIPLAAPVKRKDTFRNVQVPSDWFAARDEKEIEEAYLESQELTFIRPEECIGMDAGSSWFRGDIADRRLGKFGRYYVLFLKTYMGKSVARKNIIIAVPGKYFIKFGENFPYLKKSVEFFLEEKYLGNAPLKIRVELLT